jgi:iron complex transport system substrate-binding protein
MRIFFNDTAATEIVSVLGYGHRLVGRSHECDFPAGVGALPVCSRPRMAIDTPSAELDGSVKDIVARGLSVYRVDETMLRELTPEFIVTQTQCEVCAVSERDVTEAVCRWLGDAPRIVSLRANRLSGLWADIEGVADALGDGDKGRETVAALSARMEVIAARAEGSDHKPSVACIEWIAPLMSAGNWMPELVTMAGGRNLFGEVGEHSPWLEPDALCAADPEVIFVSPCGFDLERTRSEMSTLARLPGWGELSAVRNGRVYLADGHQYFNRPGPRLVESLEILAEMLHSDRFDFGHRGKGWVPDP